MAEKHQVVIIGSGPAGYSAGIYTARAALEPVILAGFEAGGQLVNTTEVENYPGFPSGILGPELMEGMRDQAIRFGSDVRYLYATAVDFSQRPFKIWTNIPADVDPEFLKKIKGREMQAVQAKIKESEPALLADTVIIATGASSIMLGIRGEREFLGRGVSTCAVCDAAFYKDKVTYVVGGGDCAMEDTLALTRFATEVHILHRRDEFRASKIMQDRVLNNDKVKVHWNTTLEEILGDGKVEQIRVFENGEEKTYDAEGVFIAIGHKPMNAIFEGQVELDSHGYVVTRQSLSKLGLEAAGKVLDKDDLVKFPTMTSVEGVFAGGDGVDVRYKQAVTAAGQGCSAALDAEKWLLE